MNSTDRACRLAKSAFDEAVSDLDKLKEETYRDTTSVLQLIRDNLMLWTSSSDEEPTDVGEA